MIPSINSLNIAAKENKFFNKEVLFKSPSRPKKSVLSKTSLMDEIFLRKSKIIYPTPAFPKFYTFHEGTPKTDFKKKSEKLIKKEIFSEKFCFFLISSI